ncbi:MAG: MCE family protein [Mycobacterium sp.]|nr:MCE family protein [Mycobacterium sp.]
MRRSVRTSALAVLCTSLMALAACASLPGTSDQTFTADLADAAGLYKGNSVAVLGMTVGSVTTMVPTGGGVAVTFTVDHDIAIPADVTVAVVSASVVTDRHIELSPPYPGKGPKLADGSRIPRAQTRTPVEIDEVIRTVDTLSSALATDANGSGPLGRAIDLSARTLAGNGDRIRSALDNLAGALKVGSDNSESIKRLVTSLSTLTELAADNDAAVRGFSADLAELGRTLAEQGPSLTQSIAEVDEIAEQLTSLIVRNKDRLAGALGKLRDTTSTMYRYGRQLDEVIDVLPLMNENIVRAIDPVNRVLRVHFLTDKTLLDNELLSQFCGKVQLRSRGCDTGRLADFGPDFGVTAMLLGMTR